MDDNKPFNWRDHLQVHPAADLFPLMSETDPAALKEMAEDIRRNGLQTAIVLWAASRDEPDWLLVDGRNRLDALALSGSLAIDDEGQLCRVMPDGELSHISGIGHHPPCDPYAHAVSLNIHRRHLTAEQRRELIGKLLKANPEKSDRSIAKLAKTSPTTVGTVRSTVQTGQLDKRIGADGKARKQPAKKQTQPKKSTSPDCSRSGVSQVSTTPEKLSSGLPTGSDSSKNPVQQAEIAESEIQPNPIRATWLAGTREQRQEFIRDHGDAIADSLATVKAREKDAPPRYRVWNCCGMIEAYLDDEANLDEKHEGSEDWSKEYESLVDQLSELEQTIDDALAEDEEEDADDLAIPDYLKRAAP
jgi:hypothetical protein